MTLQLSIETNANEILWGEEKHLEEVTLKVSTGTNTIGVTAGSQTGGDANKEEKDYGPMD